jgi:hypothetical protein
MPRVSLVSTLHDSTGWSIEPLKSHESLFRELYDRRLVVVTRATSFEVVDCLEASGWELVAPNSNSGVEHISDSRRRVLRAGVAGGADFVHLADMDRILHWAAKYPDELRATVSRIPEYDFTIIGRTARAMKTHPKNQAETEAIANRVFSLIYGHDVDITAASRGVSKAAAEVILRYSQGRFFDSDSEWPTILLCKSALGIGYIETEGLEWETRLKREEMTLPGGKRVDVKEYYEMNPESWVYRAMLAHRIGEAALSTYRGLGGAYRVDS